MQKIVDVEKKEEKFAFFEQKVRQVVFGIVKVAYLKALNNFSVHLYGLLFHLNPLFHEQITVGPRIQTPSSSVSQ